MLCGRFMQKKKTRPSVSRVLSCTVIYLRLPSPASSSDIHGVRRADNPVRRTPNLAAGGVYIARRVTAAPVSFYLAFPPLRKRETLPRYISVALSLKSPSPDVIRRPVLCCPDFPHGAFAPRDRMANSFSEKNYTTFFLFCRAFFNRFRFFLQSFCMRSLNFRLRFRRFRSFYPLFALLFSF